MAEPLFANNASTTLASAIDATQTSVSVVDGSVFPTPTGGNWFQVTLEDGSGNIEICQCTARSGSTLTVMRAQEGTTGTAFGSGDTVELRATAGIFNGLRDGTYLDADDIDDASTTNKFATAAQLSKIDGVESGATADQSGAEIKAAYESEADTNAFTDADHSKLDAIEASADVTDATNVAAAGAIMDGDFSSNGLMKRTGAGSYATATADTDYQSVLTEGAFADGDKTKLDNARETLTANRTYYVRTDGSDSNDGRTNSAGGAFLTIQKAINVARSIDHSIYQVTISVGAGAFAENISIQDTLGSFNLNLQGAGTSTVIGAGSGNGLSIQRAGRLVLRDFAFADNQLISLSVRFTPYVLLAGTIQFGSAAARQIEVEAGYIESTTGTIQLDGAAAKWLDVAPFGTIRLTNGVTVQTTKALTYANDFIEIAQGRADFGGSITWDETAGAITGRQCEVMQNGILQLNGAALSTIPGTITGVSASGGQIA